MQDIEAEQLRAFGEYVRAQRKLAQVSQRNVARSAGFSDSYLSQLERGMYMPSAPTVQALAHAIGLPPSVLFAQLGLLEDDERHEGSPVEEAILADPALSPAQRETLLSVYRSYIALGKQ
jgi:transcriptional regulator with XRE-family HTH domain